MRRSARFLAPAAAVLLLAGIPCHASPSGDGDDLDQRIDQAMVGVRADRPWRVEGPSGVTAAPKLDDYAPAAARPAARRGGWQFALTPVFWVPAQCGEVGLRGQTFDVDLSIGDTLESVVDNFRLAAMGRFEARCRKWSILLDVIYLDLGNEEQVALPGGGTTEVDWGLEMLVAQGLVGYEFARSRLGCGDRCFTPTVAFDAIGGARLYALGVDVDFDPGPSGDGSQTWVDPVVGLRAIFRVTPDLSVGVLANVGGFGIGSDLSWQLVGGIDWSVGRCVSLNAGWMVLDVDYEDGDFRYDVRMSGPYLGVTFRF
jgi:hypothetical protein